MQDLAQLLAEHGLALVFVNVLLTQLGVPIPAVPTLIVAGAHAHHGGFHPAVALAAAIAASLLGDLPWFAAGRRYGYRVLHLICRVAVEPAVCVQRTEDKLGRWGAPSLMIAKFVPGFATVAPPLAGATRLPLPSFVVYSAIGAALWAGLALGAGLWLHAQVEEAVRLIELAGARAAAVLAALLAAYIGVKWTQRHLFMRVLRMARISAHELYALMQSSSPPLVLDARSAAARRADPRHIPGAIPVDIDIPQVSPAVVPIDREVVIYCS